jgi:hypothetical protein
MSGSSRSGAGRHPRCGAGRGPGQVQILHHPALADSYRAELVRAARKGAEFDPVTGEPTVWAELEPVTVSWYQHVVAYAEMKWPRLAPHSQTSLADALATVTPLLTGETAACHRSVGCVLPCTGMPSTPGSGSPARRI